MRLRNMLNICLVFWESEPQYASKRYAYIVKKKHVVDFVLNLQQNLAWKSRNDWQRASWKVKMTCRGYFERVKWLAEGTFLNDNILRAVHQKEILKYELIYLTLPKMPCITQYAILWNRNQKRRKKTKSFI